MNKELEKYKKVVDKVKDFINEEHEEFEKGKEQELYDYVIEAFVRGQLVACDHIKEILEELK